MGSIQDIIKAIACFKIPTTSPCRGKMGRRYFRQVLLGAAFLAVLILLIPPAASAQPPSDGWHFTITPYVWLPNIDGEFKYKSPSGASGRPTVDVGANDYLENLDFAMMISAEARKARWSVFTDLIYLDFANEDGDVKSIDVSGSGRIPVSASIDAGTKSSLKGGAWTLGGGYSVLQGDLGRLDLIAGFRYLGIKASTDWYLTAAVDGPGGGQVFPRSGKVSQREDIWDGIIGLRGRLNLGGSGFYVPYYLDIGTGTSDLTWEGMVGLGYGFKWVDILLAYRHLYYDMGGDDLIQNVRFSGPGIGATIRF